MEDGEQRKKNIVNLGCLCQGEKNPTNAWYHIGTHISMVIGACIWNHRNSWGGHNDLKSEGDFTNKQIYK